MLCSHVGTRHTAFVQVSWRVKDQLMADLIALDICSLTSTFVGLVLERFCAAVHAWKLLFVTIFCVQAYLFESLNQSKTNKEV